MAIMETTTYANFRRNMAKAMSKVHEDHEILIVKRTKGRDVVMVSLDDWNSMAETNYLLSSSNNAKHLLKAVDELESGKGPFYELDLDEQKFKKSNISGKRKK